MKPNELERWIRDAARDYNEPQAPPREEMWAAIREGLEAGAPGEAAGESPLDLPTWRSRRDGSGPETDGGRGDDRLRRWTPWALGLAAAAMLVVGFGLGRVTQPVPHIPEARLAEAESGPSADRTSDRDAAGSDRPSLPMRLAAADHMGEAEAMLTLYRSSAGGEDRMATAAWARDLLATTRLLLDSRMGDDPEMATLLADLELVLVQIATAGASGESEQDLIEEGIAQRELLSKLRNAATPPVDVAL